MEIRKGVRFRKPPLVEALCEFHFQETGTPSNIILGRLYEKIEIDFPTVETHRGIGVQAEEEEAISPAIVMEETTRFISRDGTQLIQVGPGLLAANQLKQYEDYRSFRVFIKETMDTYYEVAKPAGLRYIGLRYINRLEMTPDQSLEDVLHIGFNIPEEFQSFPDPYHLQMEFAHHDGRDNLIIILATAPPQEDSSKAVMLDFEYILVRPDEIGDRLLEWMDEAHGKIEDAFHACLTEDVLNGFGPLEDSGGS
ncbi:TIGR04255 family protein [Candidatus Poribacteria bacterium]